VKSSSVRPQCMTSNSNLKTIEAVDLKGDKDVVHEMEDVFVGVGAPEEAGPGVDDGNDLFGEAHGDEGEGPV